MSLLFKHLRIHQVFGANTDVGKTILTSALVRASASKNKAVFYLKPVSTGPIEDADDKHVKLYGGSQKIVRTECLYRFDDPISPHLAALAGGDGAKAKIPSDATFINSVAAYIRRCAEHSGGPAHMYVETAGGVHSPTLSGTTQLESYRPLFLPTVLIGDARLGGISTTISAYESLLLRGYIVDAVLLFRDDYYRNSEYLQSYFGERDVHVSVLDPPPQRAVDPSENFTLTEKYYAQIVPENQIDGVYPALHHLESRHAHRLKELDSMPRRTLDSVWWPFVQHGLVSGEKDVTVIDSAYSDFFSVRNHDESASNSNQSSILKPEFDASASWWTQAFGHAHPSLTLAAARASGRYGHVMFPQATHLPALKLAERLVHEGPGKGWASRAFFSDNGSTGMEVAIKMALRAFTVKQGANLDPSKHRELGVIGLKGSYHGDTMGVMDATEESVYTCEWHNSKGYWFDPPTVSIRNGQVVISLPQAIASAGNLPAENVQAKSLSWAYDVSDRINSPLAGIYREYIQQTLMSIEQRGGPKLAALVIEPLVMGSGGMIFVDPLFQRVLIDVVRGSSRTSTSQWSGLPIIFDEVFVGFNRIGMQSAGPLLGVHPDISVYAKILTGGLIPLAITLASDSIFQAFLSDKKADSLLHGHSYTAHPIGCEVANETLKILDKLAVSEDWKVAQEKWRNSDGGAGNVWSFWDPEFIQAISKIGVIDEVMTLGTVLSIKTQDNEGYVSHSAQELFKSMKTIADDHTLSSAPGGSPFSIHFRTLGNVAYFMTSLNTPTSVIRDVEDRIWNTIRH